jgi:hypothetical protein
MKGTVGLWVLSFYEFRKVPTRILQPILNRCPNPGGTRCENTNVEAAPRCYENRTIQLKTLTGTWYKGN